MSDYIKYMYREYLEGRTRIKKVNEDQPLFPNTGAGLLIQKNKLTDDWTALNVSDGHYEEESFNHEALAAAFLQGANMGQLRMLNEILDRARLNGPYCLENVPTHCCLLHQRARPNRSWKTPCCISSSFPSPSPRTAASTIPSTVSISTPKSMGWAMSHISRYMMCRSQTSRNVWPGAQNTSMRFPDRSMS